LSWLLNWCWGSAFLLLTSLLPRHEFGGCCL
jgi:hypothetical protein